MRSTEDSTENATGNATENSSVHDDDPNDAKSVGEAIRRAPKNLKKWAFGILIACVLIVVGLTVYRQIETSREADRREAEIKAGPRTRVIAAALSPAEREVEIMGEARPFASVMLYAKVSGYLRSVNVDKGDKVKKGQILAVIESPETNKIYEGAQADAANKNAIAARMKELFNKELVSRQEYDQASSDAKVSQARLESAATEKAYETLRAPFDGTVTSRFADPGALMQNAANSQTSALPVLNIAQVEKLRVYAYVDQRDASYVNAGLPATIRVRERPELELHAEVARVSGELDEKTRMLLAEIDVDNVNGQLVPGSFVQVNFLVKTPPLIQVPSEAIVNQGEKTMVQVVGDDSTIKYREVKVADTDGKTVRLVSGLNAGEKVALNLGNSFPDGSRIRPLADEPAKPAAAPAPAEGSKQAAAPPAGAAGPAIEKKGDGK